MESLFRGYVPTRDKKCLVSFKGKTSAELNTYEQVKNLPEYAGILAENAVLIDIDDMEQSEIMMQIVEDMQLRCRVYQTSKGKHFLFRNDRIERCKTKTKLACGLVNIDIKIGSRNSYSILKFAGKDRPILYDIFEDEEYENVPKWLVPVSGVPDFSRMEEGDGRNQTLFNYILTLQSADFSVEEIRETIRIINKYILADKLSDSELETILRDEAFSKPTFFKNGTFLFDKFAIFLRNQCHIIKVNGMLHVYRDGIYVSGSKEIESDMIRFIPGLNRAKRQEVLAYLDILIKEDTPISPANYIAFRNGIYDLNTDSLLEFTPEIVVHNKIPFDYEPGIYNELADRTLNKIACGDPAVRALLEEAVGYCFYRRNEGLRKSFILIGERQNGKSTYLAMVQHLLGEENVSSLDLKELGDRFKTAEIVGKLANIGDDIEDEFIVNPAIFKKLVTGNPITVERKGFDPFPFSNYAKLLFSANDIPRIKDKSGSVMSRLVIIPFNATFSKEDPDFDPFIKYKLIQDEPTKYLIRLGIEGLKRILKNQEFTRSERVEQELKEYEEDNNPILLFFSDLEEEEVLNEPTARVYMKYKEFCIANGYTPMTHTSVTQQVKKRYRVNVRQKKVNGKKYRVFVREDEKEKK